MIEQSTIDELLRSARVIKSETQDGANTANRVGTMFIDIINNLNNAGGGGSAINYKRLDEWEAYDPSMAGWVLSAALGVDLLDRINKNTFFEKIYLGEKNIVEKSVDEDGNDTETIVGTEPLYAVRLKPEYDGLYSEGWISAYGMNNNGGGGSGGGGGANVNLLFEWSKYNDGMVDYALSAKLGVELSNRFDKFNKAVSASLADLDERLSSLKIVVDFADLTGKASFDQLPEMFWANVPVKEISDTNTEPTFAKIHIGGVTLSWDANNQCLIADKGIVSESFISAYGLNDDANKGSSELASQNWGDSTYDASHALPANLGYSKIEDLLRRVGELEKGGGANVNLLFEWSKYNDGMVDYALSAKLGVELNNRFDKFNKTVSASLADLDERLSSLKIVVDFADLTGKASFDQLPEMFWANVPVKEISDTNTEPTFAKIHIGGVTLSWDSTNQCLVADKGIVSESFISAYGLNDDANKGSSELASQNWGDSTYDASHALPANLGYTKIEDLLRRVGELEKGGGITSITSQMVTDALGFTPLKKADLTYANLPALYIGKTRVQNASQNQALTGITTITAIGDNTITKSNDDSTSFKATNTKGSIGLVTHSNRGVYDYTKSKWLIVTDGTNTWFEDGYIGINTSAPKAWLDVKGNTRVNGSLYLTSTYGDIATSTPRIWYDETNKCLRTNVGFVSDSFVSAYGVNGNSGGGSIIGNRLDKWSDYTSSKATWVLSALLGVELHTAVDVLNVSHNSLEERFSAAMDSIAVSMASLEERLTGFLASASNMQEKISDIDTIRTNAANGNTAYSWGNHASQGYLKSLAFSQLTSHPTTLSGYGITDNIVNTIGTKKGDITLLAGQTNNGLINLSMNGNQLQAAIVGLKDAAYHAHTDYVTSIGTSGDTLTWAKGGVAQNPITITANRLSTVSKTAWGQTYWTSGGVPTSISGNMTSVGTISANGDNTITKSGNTATQFIAKNGYGTIALLTQSNRGIYDTTSDRWLIGTNGTDTYLSEGGKVYLGSTSNNAYIEYKDGAFHFSKGIYSDSFVSAYGKNGVTNGLTFDTGNSNTNPTLKANSSGELNLVGEIGGNSTLEIGVVDSDSAKASKAVLSISGGMYRHSISGNVNMLDINAYGGVNIKCFGGPSAGIVISTTINNSGIEIKSGRTLTIGSTTLNESNLKKLLDLIA